MKGTVRRSYEMFVRAHDFGVTHAASFPASSRGGELFAALNAVVSELDKHMEAQTSHRSAAAQGTTSKAVARAALRADLEAISRTARAMAFDTPGLADRFHLPRNNSDQALINAARAFAADAAPLKSEFIRHELPADFLDTLNAHIASFEAAGVEQNRNTGARVAATQAMDDAIERGHTIVRQLDAVVRNKFRADQATLAEWTSASHTESPAKRKSEQKSAQAQTPAAPPK